MNGFQIGQQALFFHTVLGAVTETITDIRQMPNRPGLRAVFFKHGGTEWACPEDQIQFPLEEQSMTDATTPASATEPKRRGRPAKLKPVPAENPFKVGDEVVAKLADGRPHACKVIGTPSAETLEIEFRDGSRFTRHISEVEAVETDFKKLAQQTRDKMLSFGQKGVTGKRLGSPNLDVLGKPLQPDIQEGHATPEELDGHIYGVPAEVLYRPGTRVLLQTLSEEWEEGIVRELLHQNPNGDCKVEADGAIWLKRFADLRQLDEPQQAASTDSALVVTAPVQEMATPVQEVAQPVTELAAPQVSMAQPVQTIAQPGAGEEVSTDAILAAASADADIPASMENIPAELPGTPVLLNPSDVAPGTLGVVDVPLHQLLKSPCNVRMHYDEAKVQEIAASIKADGQLQEAVGRWNAQGLLEIVAGETRRRAQEWRAEQGETGLTLRVNVKELTDAQALRISAQENMQRNSMTPLEECEAMLRMQEAGDSVENIQATFGYRTAQPVADRILVAKNLATKAREALDNREISLAQAFVIARAPGAELQNSMLRDATSYNPASAQRLAEMLTRGQFLVANAQFDVEASKLEVKRDLFDAFEPYFESKGKALNAQVAWAEDKAEKLRKKGKHAFVHVVLSAERDYRLCFGQSKYEREYDKKSKERGLVLHIHESDGEYTEVSDIKLKASKQVATKKADGTTTTETVREMPASAFEAAHLLKAKALRHSLLGHPQVTLVLTVHALIASYPSYGKAPISDLPAWNSDVTTPEIQAKLTSWQAAIAAGTGSRPGLGNLGGNHNPRFDAEYNAKLYDYLYTLDTPELLDLLNVLVACRIYEPNVADFRKPTAPTFVRLAQQTNANAALAQDFKLTDEWLKRYPRHELVALAEEAGLGRALVEDCGTLKEMRARILEHADALHREGFVPALVRFPEVKAD